ncbi:MAG: hypothetical protein A2498_06660 [Lentisphaerae bacterium RIFOXYC12_FULL_60_16]|nr:MAG: hypothetical protein A2498_06660 [Lentisphaerae bacterium RIFOXYC12_FULL_60_16]OGV84837.1 MAG: hypothetical protein A2340_06620 [Lentisphaerae bacterium RIFOXYB12_FULL_60_10]
MNTLIIGGSGHVSGAVARAALAQHHAVWTLTRGKRLVIPGVKALVADRHDPAAMAALIAGQSMTWDLVVDCIGFDVPDVRQDIALFRDRAGHLVFISTDFVYSPEHRTFPQPEDAVCWVEGMTGSADYGRRKRLCELELLNGDTGRMEWTIFRPCHIYGPTSELGCLPLHGRDPKLIDRLRKGEPLGLVGGGHFLQQPLYVDDLARTIISAAGVRRACGAIFNVAGPDIIESRRYYRIVADVLGVGLTITDVPVSGYLKDHPDQAPFICHRINDLRRLQEAGLHVPGTPVMEGLRLHVEGLLARQRSLAGSL